MSKSRVLSIYLLKENFSCNNALKNEHNLGSPVDADNLPTGSVLYLLDSIPKDPWWKEYWGIKVDLKQMLKGAIIFLPVKNRCFALSFGHSYHNLKEDCYEYDFGLITTLNTLDPEKLKKTDIFNPDSAKRQSIQSPTLADLTFFDFNQDESIVKTLTGKVKDEYTPYFSNVTGASNLRINTKMQAKELKSLCVKLLKIYSKEDYKKEFPNIQNISPVKDPNVVDKLNDAVINAFKNKAMNLVLTIPEIITSDSFKIRYSRSKSKVEYDDVYIDNYREYLEESNVSDWNININIDLLKKHKLNMVDENGNSLKSYSIFKCLLFDFPLNDKEYYLCDGNWYDIDENYVRNLNNELDSYFGNSAFLIDCDERREDDYNNSVANGNGNVICLDKTNISPKGQTQVEPCDLFVLENEHAILCHIKISTRSHQLSHLFNQGLNSIELIRAIEESKKKLIVLVEKINNKFSKPILDDKLRIVYGIITAKDTNKKSENLPIFSRISLRKTVKLFKIMGISVEVVFIKDNVDRKKKVVKKK